MKLSQIINPHLKSLLEKIVKCQMPIASAWRIKGVVKEINEATVRYEEMRSELIKKYAKKDESGEFVVTDGKVNVASENMDAFSLELNELLSMDFELKKLAFTDLPNSLELSPEEAFVLEAIVD